MPIKSKAPLTDDEKYALELQNEQELKRLHREYTILERASFGASTSQLAKQEHVLNIFKKEYRNLSTDLVIATSDTKKRDDIKVSEQLSKQLTEYKSYNEDIKRKKSDINEINEQIRLVSKGVQDLRSKQVTDKQYEDEILEAQLVIAKLENKLEVQVKKFCSLCAKNRNLRDEINHLLLERENFLIIWERLIGSLTTGKKFMLDLIEQATIAYDQREEWCSKLQALRLKANNDLQLHIHTMRKCKRRQDNNRKLDDFFAVKGQKRVMKDLEDKEKAKRSKRRQEMEDMLEKYRQMIKEISEFTGEESIEVIATKFLKQEADNFVLFKYLNDLNQEMEILNDSLGQRYIEIDEQKLLHETRAEQQKNGIELLEAKLEKATIEADESEKELQEIDNTLEMMMKKIDDFFKLCKCHTDPLVKLLGDNTSIKPYNVHLYQEILENRVQELMLQVYFEEKTLYDKKKTKPGGRIIKEEHSKPKILPIEIIVNTNPCPLCVEHEQVSDVIDELQFVLNRNQVKEKLKQRLTLPDGLERLHNVSACHLPKSREIIQKRYQ